MVKAILSRSSWHFSGLIVGKFLSITLFVLLARILLPDKFGQLVLFITIFQLVTALANFGLKPWFQTRTPELGEAVAFKLASTARFFSLYLSIVVVAVILLIYQPFPPLVSLLLLIIIIPEALTSLAESYWILKKRPGRVGIKNPIFFLIVFIGWATLGFASDLPTLTALWLLASSITTIWFFPWKKLEFANLWPFSKQHLVTLKQASAYALLTTTGLIYSRADQLIIQFTRGFTALGIYSAAYRLLDSINLLPQVVAENLFPEAAQPGKISAKQLLKIEVVVGAIGATVAFALWWLSPVIVPLVLGSEYLRAVPILSILSIVLFLFFVNAPLASVVQSSRLVKKFLPFGIGNTLINVLLNLALVPIFGIMAAAWIMILTEFVGLLINLYFLKKLYAK